VFEWQIIFHYIVTSFFLGVKSAVIEHPEIQRGQKSVFPIESFFWVIVKIVFVTEQPFSERFVIIIVRELYGSSTIVSSTTWTNVNNITNSCGTIGLSSVICWVSFIGR
jgi:hypothetical protein